AIAGFAVPAMYLAGVLGVTASALRLLRLPVATRLPLALATMHVCWGIGFLTSPRSLMPGQGAASRRLADNSGETAVLTPPRQAPRPAAGSPPARGHPGM